jgi:hypothetical protein
MGVRRRLASLLAVSVVAAMIAVSCSSAPGVPAPTSSFKFRANKVTVVNHNDSFFYGTRDEPFVYNLWFRAKVGVPGSAQVGLVGNRGNAFNDLGDGQSHVLVGGETAEVNFNNVQLLDVLDLVNPANGIEVVGSWTWAMEQDDVGVSGVANDTLQVVKNALNATVAAGSGPSDPNVLVGQLFTSFGQAFNLIAGALFASIPGIPDDAIGSNFYVGVAAKGSLATIIDAATSTLSFPSVAIPIVSVPPDINGGKIFALGENKTFTDQEFSSGGARHDYDLQMINTATLNQAPFANFTATPTSGAPPLAVALNAGPSADPDGSIVDYNWNFGDFTTGSGAIASHVFTTSGTFPVTLTVTDNRGDSTSKTVNIAVGGAPTVAPTGLTKVGSGCCDTYGDFAWNPVPGATAYEINMNSFFGGGCLTDANAVVNGQTSNGRVQKFGLCLGSKYDVSIRAQANGQWGPWSGTTRITL